jgi:hypothetical protein
MRAINRSLHAALFALSAIQFDGDLRKVMIMDAISAKRLDEACNRNNDSYSEEALYVAWTSGVGICVGHDGMEMSFNEGHGSDHTHQLTGLTAH